MPRPPSSCVRVDLAVLAVRDGEFCALVGQHTEDPDASTPGLPGGLVLPDEDLLVAAERCLLAETGVHGVHLEQLKSYRAPRRDPRPPWAVSVAHIGALPAPALEQQPDDGPWRPVGPLLTGEEPLAPGHREILADAVERARSKLEYTTVASEFLGEEFTLTDLRHVYEVVWGHPLDPGNFQRKMKTTENVLEETGRTRPSPVGRGRPATIFRIRPGGPHLLKSPITRSQT